MSHIVPLTQDEHDEFTALARRAIRPASPYQTSPPDPERAAAVMLAGLRVVLGAEIAATLAGQPWQVHVVGGEAVSDADRVIRGAVLLFHHARAGWVALGDEAGQIHLLDTPEAPAGIVEPQLVDRTDEPAAELGSAAVGAPTSERDAQPHPPLRLYQARGIAMALAFAPATRTWFRSRRVGVVPTAPDAGAADS